MGQACPFLSSAFIEEGPWFLVPLLKTELITGQYTSIFFLVGFLCFSFPIQHSHLHKMSMTVLMLRRFVASPTELGAFSCIPVQFLMPKTRECLHPFHGFLCSSSYSSNQLVN